MLIKFGGNTAWVKGDHLYSGGCCSFLNRSQRPQRASLRLGQSLHAADIEALVGPIAPQRAHSPLSNSHTWIAPSSPQLASLWPSGAKARFSTTSVCHPVQSNAPLSTSHSLIVPSHLPVANSRSSGLKARALSTVSACACQARCKV